MSRTRIISSCAISKVLDSTSAASIRRPAKNSPYARATRAGVSARPSRSGSSPIASSSSRTAASARAWSTTCAEPSVVIRVDLTTLGHLDDLGRRVLLGRLGRAGLGSPVDRLGGLPVRAGRLQAVRTVLGGLLGRGQHGRLVGEEPRLAREPGGAQRALADRGEDRGQLLGVERLVLEQVEDEAVEDVAVVVDDVPRLVVRVLDERAHLRVDDAGDLLAVVALVAHVAAEEDLALALAELCGAGALAHAVLADHLAGHRGRLLDVVGGTGGGVVEHDLLGD